jgi:subtilase family serine protease
VIQSQKALSLQSAHSHHATRSWLYAILTFAITLATLTPNAHASEGELIAQSTPAYVSTNNILRAEDPSKVMEVSLWLKPHNRSQLDTLAAELYDPKSPQYRHWLKATDIAARFAPTAAEAKSVQTFLESQNLKVVATGPNNFYVRARGTAADVEQAFHVHLNYYQVDGKTLRSNDTDPFIEGAVAALVQSVSGLDDAQAQHHLHTSPITPASPSATGPSALALATVTPETSGFETVCFPGTQTESFDTEGSYPKATYKGNSYQSGNAGCAYAPSNVYGAYGLKNLYAKGFDGTGQTIVIIDWCGSPTILQDANVFSKKFDLPRLTSANFNIIDVPSPSQCSAPDLEINLDVEWAHAIAPGANIQLIVPVSAYTEDLDEAWLYAVNYGLGNVISGSYGLEEKGTPAAELDKENLIAEIGVLSGIASNFSSGDAGNYAAVGPSVSVPADLPYATAVGGVTLALNADDSMVFQTAWQNYRANLISGGVINDPPVSGGSRQFIGGSGGGPSAYFSKPSFQKSLKGKFRNVPDISWLADPYTAVQVSISEPGQVPEQVWVGVGGTSVACPMFSALWAIANQVAGQPLGQAAPYLYSMPEDTITDVLLQTSTHNVTAVIKESASVTNSYNAADTLRVQEPLFGDFYSVVFNYPLQQGTADVISFGGSYYLKPTVGWDDVTGLGVPSPTAFINYFAPTSAEKK